MMGVEAHETCWATHKASSNKLVKLLHLFGWIIWIASSCLSVCLSVRPHETTRLSLDGFSWNLVNEDIVSKIFRQNSCFIKNDQNKGYFNKLLCIYTIIPIGVIVRKRHISDKCCGENPTHIFCIQHLLFKNRTAYETMWKNVLDPDSWP